MKRTTLAMLLIPLALFEIYLSATVSPAELATGHQRSPVRYFSKIVRLHTDNASTYKPRDRTGFAREHRTEDCAIRDHACPANRERLAHSARLAAACTGQVIGRPVNAIQQNVSDEAI